MHCHGLLMLSHSQRDLVLVLRLVLGPTLASAAAQMQQVRTAHHLNSVSQDVSLTFIIQKVMGSQVPEAISSVHTSFSSQVG